MLFVYGCENYKDVFVNVVSQQVDSNEFQQTQIRSCLLKSYSKLVMWPVVKRPTTMGNISESNDISERSNTNQNESSDEPKDTTTDHGAKIKQENHRELKSSCSTTNDENALSKRRSASRDSSVNDDPKSLMDSISATSGRQNWSSKDIAEDNPSISSIRGDSISATIADYNRKHRNQISDEQSRASGIKCLGVEGDYSSPKIDDLSSNINFYAACGSTSVGGSQQNYHIAKPGDFVSVSSAANTDAFDLIEESNNVSSCEDLSQINSNNRELSRDTTHNHNRHVKLQRRRPTLLEQALDIDDLPQEISTYQIEPIVLRGNGNLTLFGLSNSFSAEFPSSLIGRVSREEFDRTMRRVNSLLKDQQSLSAKILLFGGLCCCCSLGFSLIWPSIALKKRSKTSLEKFLASENSRLYSKLGLNWKLSEQRCYSNHAFVEYVLMIEFTPKINLYLPD